VVDEQVDVDPVVLDIPGKDVWLECLRAGFWGTQDTWGRMLTYGARNER
jgi:phosphosulfolactate synthase (CoM biosynthesis protein A)